MPRRSRGPGQKLRNNYQTGVRSLLLTLSGSRTKWGILVIDRHVTVRTSAKNHGGKASPDSGSNAMQHAA